MKAPAPVRTLAPAGTFPARLVNIIYMGTIRGEYQGTPTEGYKVRLSWELPTKLHVFKEGDPQKPFMVSKEVTLSMGKKSTLRPLVEGMIGVQLKDEEASSFDIDDLLGKPCLISITHGESPNGKYVAVKSTVEVPEGMTCPPAFNPLKILSYDKFDKEYFAGLPKFIQEKMEKTPEFIKMNGGATINPADIPF